LNPHSALAIKDLPTLDLFLALAEDSFRFFSDIIFDSPFFFPSPTRLADDFLFPSPKWRYSPSHLALPFFLLVWLFLYFLL